MSEDILPSTGSEVFLTLFLVKNCFLKGYKHCDSHSRDTDDITNRRRQSRLQDTAKQLGTFGYDIAKHSILYTSPLTASSVA